MLLKSKRIINQTLMLLFLAALMASCSKGNGELIGVQDREDWYQDDPAGMLFIPQGSYNMGASDQDVPYSQANPAKTHKPHNRKTEVFVASSLKGDCT